MGGVAIDATTGASYGDKARNAMDKCDKVSTVWVILDGGVAIDATTGASYS